MNKTKNKKKRNHRADNLKHRYGITIDEYEILLKTQNDCCAICGKSQDKEKKRFAVDHNHKTGHIRGLLCIFCNSRLLKYTGDDKKRVIGLIKYLQKALSEDKYWSE